MYNYLVYLLQTTIWFIPLYLLYLTLYKRFTFFAWNRYYLLAIVLVSFAMPFIKMDIITQKEIAFEKKNVVDKASITTIALDNKEGEVENNFTINNGKTLAIYWYQIVFVMYISIVLFLLVKLLLALYAIKRLIKITKHQWTNNLAVVYTNDKLPHSSFFHYIFLNNKINNGEDVDKIILHEMQHNEKLHTVDVLFCEILKIVFWFNPLIYWYKNSLQEIHEFEVDSEMTKLYNEVTYAELLVKVASNNTNSLFSTFSSKPLKTRLKMIFNPKTYPIKKLSFLLVLPLMASLLMAYGNVHYKTITTENISNENFVIVIDAGHGGADNGAIGPNGETEKELNLAIAKQLEQKAKAAGYKVIMTRNNNEDYPGLKNRVAIADSVNADLFISIHINSENNKLSSKKGIEFYTRKNNDEKRDANSILAGLLIATELKNLKGIEVNKIPQVRDAGIYVLQATHCPATLFEFGYLNNATDLEFITKKENQNQIADKMIEGINNYFKTVYTNK